jgi:hypothetical protein
MACYWKDGVRTDLPDASGEYEGTVATAVALSGGKVYVSGYLDGYGKTACYWVDGTIIPLTPPSYGSDPEIPNAQARDIAVSGNTVYTAGWYRGFDHYADHESKPCYWTNTDVTLLPIDHFDSGQAESIVVLGDKVYIAGWYEYFTTSGTYTYACYWVKEGNRPVVRHDLPQARISKAFDITVAGGNIYVAGAYNINDGALSSSIPCYWRVDSSFNATTTALPRPDGEGCFANAIAVDNGTIYITGSMHDYTIEGDHDNYYGGGAYGVIYWKNGVLTLTSGAPAFGENSDWGEARDIAVYEGKVYIAGGHIVEEAQVEDSPVPCYWKDGQAVNLYDPVYTTEEARLERIGIATGIAISD